MKRTLISHFYNEEYLLPWWLKHHREIFDHGVMINCSSTDSSVDIIRELCPNWEIVDSVNKDFDALTIEPEVQGDESKHRGWKMVLNTTEFLIGDFSMLNDRSPDKIVARCHIMVDSPEDEYNEPDQSVPLVKSRSNGINTLEKWGKDFQRVRNCRMIHKMESVIYDLGRHYPEETTQDMHVLWYGFSPFTERLLERKLQIKTRIPEHNVRKKLGWEHMYPREKMVEEMKKFQSASRDISNLIGKYT